ncbi:MAG: SIS domain-containing protein [Acidobacteriota bacterium]
MGKTVFTNGCFDILHAGHVDLLNRARSLGDHLIVGINSDMSIRRIKGVGRPFVDQVSRRELLLALRSVDEVEIFDESTPEALIRRLNPDVLVKGGDWQVNEIIGSGFVLAAGGEVFSLPLKAGFSSTRIVEAVRAGSESVQSLAVPGQNSSIDEHIEVFRRIDAATGQAIKESIEILFDTFQKGNKLLVCGNGGSAADAQHLAAEFVGRYETERIALPAIALTTDTSALTALSNDYGFERVFARQVEALASEGDCLVAISTSGNSPNVIAAVMTARAKKCRVIGMTGQQGKKLSGLCDVTIMVPSERTARIQEAHITIAHVWCEAIDDRIAAVTTTN